MTSNTDVQTEFQADLIGDYVVQLIVDDGELQSSANTALIRINALPSLTVFVTPLVGGGLQVAGSGTLASTNHGGVSVRIESSDPATLLVAPDPGTAGSRLIDVFVPDGSRDYSFVAQGVPRRFMTATVMAAAPGFADASRTVEVAPPGPVVCSTRESAVCRRG